MTPRVLVVGALNVDLVVTAPRLPGRGETVVGPGVERYGGGKGANAAVAAARAGAQVRFCGAVGADPAGTGALDELRAEGIDVADVAVLDGVATGTALIVVDAAGENQIAVGAGANAQVTEASVRAAVARAVGWAGCVLVSTEIPGAAVAAAVEAARAHGLVCVLNPAPVVPELLGVLGSGAVVTPNATEMRDLHALLAAEAPVGTRPAGDPDGDTVDEMALGLADRTTAPVVVTLGGDGCLVVEPAGEPVRLPARADLRVRDTTGAGDTFNGVLAVALAAGAPVAAAAHRAVAAASLSVTAVGARAGMPRSDEIDAAAALTPRRTRL